MDLLYKEKIIVISPIKKQYNLTHKKTLNNEDHFYHIGMYTHFFYILEKIIKLISFCLLILLKAARMSSASG